jgi:hypothetical protein
MKTLSIIPIAFALCSFASTPEDEAEPTPACVPGCTAMLTISTGTDVTIELEIEFDGKKVENTACQACAGEECEGEVRFRYDGPNDWEATSPDSQAAFGTGRYGTTWLLKTPCAGTPGEYTFETDGGGVTMATLNCGC